MTPTLIVVVNEIGREKNPFREYIGKSPFETENIEWYNFEKAVKPHPAPNIPDGEHRAYLQWQWQNPYTPNKRWEDEPNEANHEHSMSHGYKTQQIWKLSEEQQPEGETPKSPDYLAGFAAGAKSRDEEVNELKTRMSMRHVAYFI